MINSTSTTDIISPLSLQYILISGYVIISWGTFNFISILSKIMFIYITRF